MKILFLIYHGFSESSGISKKIHYQINGLRALGHEVHECTYDILPDGTRARRIDGKILQRFGKGRLAAMKKRCCYKAVADYAKQTGIEFVYARSFHNANPFTIKMFRAFRKAGIRSVIEIPTYPYDQEYVGFSWQDRFQLCIDQLFRKALAKATDYIVTFTDDKYIFGQKTLCISNGIELESIPLKRQLSEKASINFIGVAEVHYWHGFDRFIAGMGEYYKKGGKADLFFHIVGGVGPSEMYDSIHAPGFQTLIQQYNLQEHIIFHGQMFGEALTELFNQADFGVGSLARHRSGITTIKTLKNREYGARGIPFIYSETDTDFDYQPYIIKAPADETPIDIQQIIDFQNQLKLTPAEIRETVEPQSWKNQMAKVIKGTYGKP